MADARDPLTSLRWALASYAAPALLVLIAGTQVYHGWRNDLCRWRGGGFAMFSTIDSPDQRLLRAYWLVNEKEVPMKVPTELNKLNAETRLLPSRKNLARLGKALVVTVRESFGEQLRAGKRDQIIVRVEVWRPTFELAGHELRYRKVRELLVRGRS